MIRLDKLLDMVCTEAIEHGGLREVPDRTDGTIEHYHEPKRNARGEYQDAEGSVARDLPPIRYDLELLEASDGALEWVD